MNRYYRYTGSGGIDAVIIRVIDCNHNYSSSIVGLLNQIIDEYDTFKDYQWKDFNIKHHGYDTRLHQNVFSITTDHSGYKNQHVTFFIETNI